MGKHSKIWTTCRRDESKGAKGTKYPPKIKRTPSTDNLLAELEIGPPVLLDQNLPFDFFVQAFFEKSLDKKEEIEG